MSGVKPEPLVLIRREGAILTLTLNRPDKSNSLHPDLVKQLSAALKSAEADTALSVVVLTGQNISAAEAFRIGLVNHVYSRVDLMPRTMELASVLAAKPRNALFETKRLTRELIDLDTNTAFEEMNKSLYRCLASEEHRQR